MFNFFKITPKKRTVKIGKKYGILYSNPPKKRKMIFYTATILVVLDLIYLGYLYIPLAKSFIKYKFSLNQQKTDTTVIQRPANNIFSVLIPKIGANADIVADVSPYNKKEYLSVLSENKVAQSATSDLPGLGKNKTTYLFAHSTEQGLNMVRKNSVFYLLDELVGGNLIYIRFKGNLYQYKVYDKKIISYKEAEYLNYKDENREVLILQTCWPIGTNWKRLLIFAERI